MTPLAVTIDMHSIAKFGLSIIEVALPYLYYSSKILPDFVVCTLFFTL